MCRFSKLGIFLIIGIVLISLNSCRSAKVHENKNAYSDGKILNENITSQCWNSYNIKLTDDDNILLYNEVEKWLGVPYRNGGNDKTGVDCSGLVVQLYKSVYGMLLERTSFKIFEENCFEISKKELKEGDLVFFSSNMSRKKISHVGLFLKEGKFVHTSSSKGVRIDSLTSNYYKTHYIVSGRVKK